MSSEDVFYKVTPLFSLVGTNTTSKPWLYSALVVTVSAQTLLVLVPSTALVTRVSHCLTCTIYNVNLNI